MMRYGYFLAEQKAHRGDRELSETAEVRWNLLGLEKPQLHDGVSIWIQDGIVTTTIVSRDFFCLKPPRNAAHRTP